MAMPANAQPGEVACPDPSAHHQHNKLSEQASSAALYVTDPARGTDSREDVLGADGKLSSRSAATSLKYARAQDLPSFPTHGLNPADSASKAAFLAKDYKMKDLWQPELSSAGSRAALLAHRDGGKLDLWEPSASKEGNSAAVLAMRTKGLSPELDRGYTADGKHRALLAANLSVHRTSTPPAPSALKASYPDAENASHNALNAATKVHRASSVKVQPSDPDGWNSDAMQAARVKNLGSNVSNPAMWGERPPVRLEREEKEHNAALRASAVSMAKQMYEHQNRTALRTDPAGIEGADAATARQPPSAQMDVKQEALRYIHLQDAAHKLAQERLAKVDKNFENAKYREYYGYPDQQTSPRKSIGNRLSIRGRGRRRAASDGDLDDSDDEEQARRIRHQMTQLNTGLSQVDEKKRTDDRARLLAAAEKKVHARMHDMDEKVFADTGKVPPAMMEEWEAKARERAQKDRDLQAQNPGKTHIGGGKFIDQSEIEAIAAARLKPTLDEINATAEKRRARDQELRDEKEEQERQKREDKQQKREEKEEQKRVKNEEKAAKQQAKDEARARKSEEQRKSREVKREGVVASTAGEGEHTEEEREMLETDKKDKRKSTLGRFTSRFKRDRKTSDEGEEEKEVDKTPVAAVAASAGAAAGGVAVTDAAKPSEGEDAEDRAVSDVSAVSEPEYEPHPAVAVPLAQHHYTHTEPAIAEQPSARMAALERHYSHIGDSEDDVSSNDDVSLDDDDQLTAAGLAKNEGELAEKGKHRFSTDEPLGEGTAEGQLASRDFANDEAIGTGAAGGGLAGQAGVATTSNLVGHEHRAHEAGEDINPGPPGQPHTTVAATRLDPNSPVEPSTVSYPASSDDSQVSRSVSGGAYGSGVGAVAFGSSQRATAETPEGRGAGDETGPAPNTAGPHSSDFANVIDPRVQPEPHDLKAKEKRAEGKPAESAQPTEKEQKGIRGVLHKAKPSKQGESATATTGDETGPAPKTAGPHKSDAANVVDPRVQPEPEKLKAREKQRESRPAASEQPTEKEQKGLRGLFSRFKKDKNEREPGKITSGMRHGSRSDGKPSSDGSTLPASSTTTRPSDEVRPTKPELVNAIKRHSQDSPPEGGETHAGHVGTDGPIGEPGKISGIAGRPGAASPSSFKRGEGGLKDLDDVSSSGLEEEDYDRGRGSRQKTSKGGLAEKLGLGKSRSGETEDEESDAFEEARDHFDEGLAPPPAFAGQLKSSSPVRETRFREEV